MKLNLKQTKGGDLSLRTVVKLPNGSGKKDKVAVLCEPDKLQEAKSYQMNAIKIKPDFAEAHCNLGNMLKELGRLSEAENYLNQSIALKPEYAEAHNNLGSVLKELHEYDRSVSSYTEAIRLKSDFGEAHYNLGRLFMSSGSYQDAVKQFELTSFKNSKFFLLQCLYSLDKKDCFIDLLDQFINDDRIDPLFGSL